MKTAQSYISGLKLKSSKGFTLVELLVVIVIIAVLATAIIVAINPAQKVNASKDSKVQGDMNQMISALIAFNTEGGAYPFALTDLTAATTTVGTVTVNQEIKSIPTPPSSTYTYAALQTSGGSACTNAAGNCAVASLYGPAYNQGTNLFWCWKSSTNTLTAVVATTNCAP